MSRDEQRWVIHYKEIGTKGDNRRMFERRLVDNVVAQLGHQARVKRFHGRLLMTTELPREAVVERLERVPGIAFFAPVTVTELELEAISRVAVALARAAPPGTFAIRPRRSNKRFPITSLELGREVGAAVQQATGREVRLGAPDLALHIDLLRMEALLYTERIAGAGGLPVGASGTVVALMSGGIDSPVAAYRLIRRGCRAVLLHFHNYSRQQHQVRSKLVDIARVLARYQGPTKLYLVPFADLQAAIIATVPPPTRMIAYRRMMLQIGHRIVAAEGAGAFVTGDAVGQVASQTLVNLQAIHAAAEVPVLSPLIGDDKDEITRVAQEIGTYEVSIRPYEDCCTYLVARHPDTGVSLPHLLRRESRIPLEELAANALEEAEVHEVEADFAALAPRSAAQTTAAER